MSEFIGGCVLRQAVAALDRVIRADRIWELKERIAADWRHEREERMNRSIGYPSRLVADLRDITKADTAACESAVTDYLSPSYSRVALLALVDFAAELERPAAVVSRDDRPAVIRRAHQHAVQQRAGQRRRGCA